MEGGGWGREEGGGAGRQQLLAPPKIDKTCNIHYIATLCLYLLECKQIHILPINLPRARWPVRRKPCLSISRVQLN